jgi:hypothetical protein
MWWCTSVSHLSPLSVQLYLTSLQIQFCHFPERKSPSSWHSKYFHDRLVSQRTDNQGGLCYERGEWFYMELSKPDEYTLLVYHLRQSLIPHSVILLNQSISALSSDTSGIFGLGTNARAGDPSDTIFGGVFVRNPSKQNFTVVRPPFAHPC